MIDLQNSQCAKCKLCTLGRKNVVNGSGNEAARILLVSEWPGNREDQSGNILTGPVAMETFKLLAKAGISRDDVFLTTTVRCVPLDANPPAGSPPGSIRTPTKDEIAACADYLDQEIDAIKPHVIVPMGTLAVRRIFGKVVTLSDTRGKEHWSERYNCKVIPIYHPSFLQHKPEYQGFTIEDLRRIKKSAAYPELTPKVFGKYIVAETKEMADKIFDRMKTKPHYTYDIETNSLDFTTGKVLSISFSWEAFTGVTIPLIRYEKTIEQRTEIQEKPVRKKNKVTGQMEKVGIKQIPVVVDVEHEHYHPYWGEHQDEVVRKIKEVLENDAIKIAHNGKFDNKFLRRDLGIEVNNFMFDTMLMDFLLDENAEDMHGLKDCAWRFTDMGGYEEPLEQWFVQNGIRPKDRNYAMIPPKMLYEYAAMDADCTMRLYNVFLERMEQQNLLQLLKKLVMPLVHTLTDVEYVGVLLDTVYHSKIKIALQAEIARLENNLKATAQSLGAPADMNFNSTDQLAELFFNILKLNPIKRTASGKPSVDEEVLKALAPLHPVADQILVYKKHVGMLSKYVDGLMERVDKDGLLHSDFLIHGTVTGRLSSANPNLQNIPREPLYILDPNGPDTWEDKETKTIKRGYIIKIKTLFIPRPGYIWVEADYGQAEFRHWANYSQDQVMIQDILAADNGTGPDIHKKTASQGWGIPLEQVTKKLRDQAKTIVFGIMYGRGAKAVAEEIGITEQQAQKIIDAFFGRYPVAKAWLNRTIAITRRDRKISSIFGRIRRLPGINSPIDYVREENERLAVNSPIQSAASDMNCNAANRIRKVFQENNIDGHLLILVHDAIYCEVAEKDFDRGIIMMREAMEKPISGVTVPMRAEFKVGSHWGNAEKFNFEDSKIKEGITSGSI